MTKEDYDSNYYRSREFVVIEIPYGDDCWFMQKLLAEKGIHYDYRVNIDNGRNVLIIFKDNLTEE